MRPISPPAATVLPGPSPDAVRRSPPQRDEPPDSFVQQPRAPVPATRRWSLPLLIGGGCLLAALLVACIAMSVFGVASRSLLPATPPPPTPAIGGTGVTAAGAPTPEAGQTPTPDPGITIIATAPTVAATSAPTVAPTDATAPTPAPAGGEILTQFSPEQLQQLRQQHDGIVGSYRDVLFETFDQGERTKGRWTQTDTAEGARRLVNNRYELTMKQPRLANSDLASEALGTSYTVEATVRFPRIDVPAMAGIAFDTQAGTEQAWLFVMTSAGEWRLYSDLRLFASGGLPQNFALAAETDYSLWVLRLPDRSELYFNATPVAVVPASQYAGGRVGVVGISTGGDADVPVTVYIDNVLIKQP